MKPKRACPSRSQPFRLTCAQTGREPLRSTPEYMLELLTLGVLWKVYAGRSGSLPPVTQQALVGLVSLRKKNARLKAWPMVCAGS